jgi:glycosyltransferase involved in cell wall biosynthesis
MEAYWHKWRKSYEQVDLFLCPSRFLANLVSHRIAPEKIKILHNGVDTKKYQANFSDQGYAFYFGRLTPEKGIITLLEAHEQVKEKIPLKIAGTGPLEEELRKKYSYVEFLGHQSHRELHNVIANSAFVVVPSEWYENCSMVVLEAMAFGKPIIASRIGGIPEQIQDNKTGLLFARGSAMELTGKMEFLSHNIKLRNQMGYAARKKLENEYALTDHNHRLLEIYSMLLENKV